MKNKQHLFMAATVKAAIIIIITTMIITADFYPRQAAADFYPCKCEDNRVLRLTTPLMQGGDIKILQKELKKLGLYQGVIDGVYGLKSAEAVFKFQGQQQLKQDGIAGEKVWQLIGEILEANILKPIHRATKPPAGEISLRINLYNRVLTVMVDDLPYRNYPVTIGKDNTSPVGEWIVKNKYVRLDKGPLGSRWLGLNVPWGVYGIHGTNKPWEIGRATSLGCIRMHNLHIEEVFEWVKVDTRVRIDGPWPGIELVSNLKPGQSGRQVQELQRRLRKAGFYDGSLDGNYGDLTEKAVGEIEALFALKIDGVTDDNILSFLNREYP